MNEELVDKIAEPSGPEYVVKNRLQPADEAIHGWYRFVLGYPPHLVREYLKTLEADPARDWVFDPFCGTATTPVEARLQGFSTLSTDANPISILATRVKLSWDVDLDEVQSRIKDVLELANACLRRVHLTSTTEANPQLTLFGAQLLRGETNDIGLAATDFDPDVLLPPKTAALIPQGFISRKPLLRVLALRYAIERIVLRQDIRDFMALALANTIVTTAGNVGFGPEIYRLPPREDADVVGAFTDTVTRMVSDLQAILTRQRRPFPPAHVFKDDARTLSSLEGYPPIGIVITSPPYPNEKDYTRSTRLESVLLGLITTQRDLRALKSSLLRSNTRNVFVGDDDDTFIKDIPSIIRVAEEIEERRLRLRKTSGFERLYHRVTRLYFGGMYRHLTALWSRLRPGARCAYVVGDQMSYFRVHIRTAQLLADVAIKAGYQVEGIELWRTRRSTTTRQDLLVDIFTGLTCFHIQSHYRSFVAGMGEAELDALYVGVDKTGTLFVIPIEAKSQAESEMIGRIQISQMAKLVRQDFAELRRRILAIKALADGTIAMVEFDDHEEPDDFGIVSVGRFRLIRRGREV